MKTKIKNEWRNKKGAYKNAEITKIANEIDKSVKEIFKKHKGKLSEDTIAQFISSSALSTSYFNIAMNAKH